MYKLGLKLIKRAVLILLVLPICVVADTLPVLDGNYWLGKIQDSYKTRNFELTMAQATVIANIEPITFTHGVVDNRAFSHWVYLNGIPSGHLILENAVMHFMAGQEPFVVHDSSQPTVFTRIQTIELPELLKSYEPLVTGKQRIAGRDAIILRLSALGHDRYSYDLAIDETSGILMQVITQDPNDKLIESFVAMRLDIFEEPSEIIKRVSSTQVEIPSNAQVSNNEDLTWHLTFVPQGFQRVFSQKYMLSRSNMPIEHQIYSDGLVEFSVYKIASIGSMEFPIVKQNGTNLYRQPLPNNSRFEIIVIGDLPIDTETKIAQGYAEK